MKTEVLIRMRKKIKCKEKETITLQDIALIEADEQDKVQLQQVPIHTISKKDGEFLVIEAFMLLAILRRVAPMYQFECKGPEETIIEVEERKRKPSLIFLFIVWIILFVGTAMTIMNFHYDVSMPEVHEKLHYLLTGEHESKPYYIQIPYSLGLGVGMILFLNHWFKKRINEEPSPLEIELHKYEQEIDNYIRHFENELNDEERHF